MTHLDFSLVHRLSAGGATARASRDVLAVSTTEKYSIAVDRVAAFVRIKLGGFFTLGDVRDFAVAQASAYDVLASAKGQHVTLCDVSECKIQLQEVVEAFRGLLTDQSLMSERMAFVTGTSPAKMQIRRLIARDSCRFFEDVESAERWLLGIDHAPEPQGSDRAIRR